MKNCGFEVAVSFALSVFPFVLFVVRNCFGFVPVASVKVVVAAQNKLRKHVKHRESPAPSPGLN
jgi:hypothetical protein